MSPARAAIFTACAIAGITAGAVPAPASAPSPATTAQAPIRASGPARVATVATGLEIPWEIAFLPDGRALITERPGRVRLMTAQRRLLAAPAARVTVRSQGEGGLLGLAVDPLFAANRFVYLYRTTQTGNEVLRYRLVGTRLLGPVVIVRGIPAGNTHDGGRLRFGPDRFLYITTGDTREEALAQNAGSLAGKFLRMSPAAYRGARAVRPAVFSRGHRNPQGLDWQPGTGLLVATEHGPDGFDEINIVRRGANYGWPTVFGNANRAGLVAPIVVYPQSIAPSGATFVRRPASAWTGDFLVAALRGEQIRRVRLRAGRAVIDQPLFAGRHGRLRTVVEARDGTLYALTSNRDGRGTVRAGDDRVLRIIPPRG